MGVSHRLSSLGCELRIIQAKNIELKSSGSLFVRYYLSAGKNKRVRLDSQEISSKSDIMIWNESFCLDCLGTEDSLNDLKQQTVVFELRWRSTSPVLRKMGKSQLLGRVEMPWKAVFESANMEMEKWITMVPMNNRVLGGLKPPSLQVAMRVRAPTMVEILEKKGESCVSEDGSDYDVFALVAAFDEAL